MNDKYFLTGRLEDIINEMRSKNPRLFGSKEKMSISRSNSILYDIHNDQNSSKTSLLDRPTESKGLYKDMLSLFIKKNDPVVKAFDYNFPGFWSSIGTQIPVPHGDQNFILSQRLSDILNICSEAGIRIHITLDDFQVSFSIIYIIIICIFTEEQQTVDGLE